MTHPPIDSRGWSWSDPLPDLTWTTVDQFLSLLTLHARYRQGLVSEWPMEMRRLRFLRWCVARGYFA